MGKIISAFLLFTSLACFCQETKPVVKHTSFFTEEYSVLKDDKKVLHGSYIKYETMSLSLIETGNYTLGLKDGLWQTYYHRPVRFFSNKKYNQNSLWEQGTFSKGKKNGLWVVFHLDTLESKVTSEYYGKNKKADSTILNVEQQNLRIKLAGRYLNDERIGEWYALNFAGEVIQGYDFSKSKLLKDVSISDSLSYNTNRRPLFIGGKDYLIELLIRGFNIIPIGSTLRNDSSSVTVKFIIDKEGRVSNPVIDKSNAQKILEKEALKIISTLNLEWIPALEDGAAISSEYKVSLNTVKTRGSSYSFSVRAWFQIEE